ncbi:MAG: serpin family protein [Planctomycetia bacterium]|nr:serpin family protein [Planctomycetia bacterium]
MKHYRIMFLLLIGAITLSALSLLKTTAEPPPIQSTLHELRKFAEQNNDFGIELYHRLRTQPGNVFFSPYSISTALAMVSTGARNQTEAQMLKCLHLGTDQKLNTTLHRDLMTSMLHQPKGYEIRIANALWGQNAHPFKADFVTGLQHSFRAEGRTLDFAGEAEQSRTIINQWVEAQTNQRIKNLLPSGSITGLTRLVLTNAIYFKGTWQTPFSKSATRPGDFFITSDDKVKAEMMARTASMRYAENDLFQALELPYAGDRLSMVILLPRKRNNLGEAESQLSSGMVSQLVQKMTSPKVILSLPRIKTTYEKPLKTTLVSMGMTDAFEAGIADFSGIDSTRELYISEVYHKAFCEINEEGTEAAAATAVAMVEYSTPSKQPPPVEFKADHPYLYLIRDRQTGSILFMGRVVDPRQ